MFCILQSWMISAVLRTIFVDIAAKIKLNFAFRIVFNSLTFPHKTLKNM